MFNKVVMILNISDFGLIAGEVNSLNIPGITVSKVEGYGSYINEFSDYGLCESLKVEVYTNAEEAQRIADIFSEMAKRMTEGGGIVAIEPVSALLNNKKLT